MARFIVIHDAVTDATQEQIIQSARQVLASLPPGTEWLRSWVIPETWKLFCEWEAPNADTIRALLEPSKLLLPIETIHEVQPIDPTWYK